MVFYYNFKRQNKNIFSIICQKKNYYLRHKNTPFLAREGVQKSQAFWKNKILVSSVNFLYCC